MSTITDVSGKLGEYMLKGWILTDTSCPTPGCRIPLMRSPNGTTPQTYFCANCDGFSQPSTSAVSDALSQTSSNSSHSEYNRSSTPPTEVTSALSSPTFAPGVETEEALRRRQQSDFASAEIGKRLLKGWAMLGEECPNIRCYGVPLVRPPRTGGDRSPLKECVVCGTSYTTQTDEQGWERLVSVNPAPQVTQPRGETSASTRGLNTHMSDHDNGSSNSRVARPSVPPINIETQQDSMVSSLAVQRPHAASTQDIQTSVSATASALTTSSRSLEMTLQVLSRKLNSLCNDPAMVDPSSVSVTADAISKVTQALASVKQLQWSESQAQVMS
ncbi:hypothetical protein SERLA73DRAFT_180361 [Serpula lacrymans var. lacrymans S7.3]|uniref:Sjogrens syndrome scleroderma autoantigen 1 family protein n=2 Tax=Serpula lacrymans var. lacrymans TaxID=341189 RepID=F8PU63_SERL3|nr:uncharacterized protein SERLADRAFT_465940 [Serpula lacrymans var. lacrymans S7.9]EGO00003.1 hypothetical protein SERLA73DRAFT_180361 [Serpula lacrymans var. lacrymans S7.3]EGO25582.1 hypothetical protein SERLADRAFT_465940 [Serpula lacrymans var. lacrymans S7.9]